MIALLTMLAALAASPAPSASPDAAASPARAASAAPSATPAENAAMAKLARAQFDAFAAGKIDKSRYSIDVPAASMAQVQLGLSSLGAVKSQTLLKTEQLAQGKVYVYRFTCERGAAIEQFSIKDGKINGIYFAPAQ